MGLTWIDHDTIEKPVEELSVGTAEAEDIEFTIETLRPSGAGDRGAATQGGAPGRREIAMSKKVVGNLISPPPLFFIRSVRSSLFFMHRRY